MLNVVCYSKLKTWAIIADIINKLDVWDKGLLANLKSVLDWYSVMIEEITTRMHKNWKLIGTLKCRKAVYFRRKKYWKNKTGT